MPKRRRLLTPMKNRAKANANKQESSKSADQDKEESTPRGRLKGALLEVLEPTADESDTSNDQTPVKRDRKDYMSDDDDKSRASSPPRQSYVLKLFDRSVDLSQFTEDSPLYPICRAWITNQPKANYKDLGNQKKPDYLEHTDDSIELPGPEGPPISRIPSLIPGQIKASKDNINLNYSEAPPPSREQLLQWHAQRWAGVRDAWLQRAARVEARYSATQRLLNKMNVNAM